MSAPLRIATYNIRKCIGTDRRRDPRRIARVLAALDADVLALQEADRRFGDRQAALPPQIICEETPYEPVQLGIRPGGIGWHGNALLVRKGAMVRGAHPLDLPVLEPRGAVLADIEIKGHALRVIGMHLDLSGLWRRRQIRAVLAQAERGHHLPTVMMGDLNQWSDRGAMSEFAFHHHRLVMTPKSFHAKRPMARLDRMIVSHDIHVLATGTGEAPEVTLASDHLPVWADIRIGQP